MNAALLALAALSIDAEISWQDVSGTTVVGGREYRFVSTEARTTLYACNTARNVVDGFEVARAYKSPDVAIPELFARIAG